jgi:hypothetical protein
MHEEFHLLGFRFSWKPLDVYGLQFVRRVANGEG